MTPVPVSPFEAHLIYALAWASFGFGHSWLAGHPRQWRLAYNLVAAVHIALVVASGRYLLGGAPFAVPGWAGNLLTAVQVVGWGLGAWALKGYDLGLFAGTRQLREGLKGRAVAADEPLAVGGLNAWVRHPLYGAALLILWGGADGTYGLATAAWGSLYLLIGAFFEERRLLALYGTAYADYRRRVPAFVPWKGRAG